MGQYLSADGTGLLGPRQSTGDPCSGWVVEQDIVEIDPATGEIGREYAVPDDHDRSWRVGAMDKVHDGEWTMVEGSEDELTWWQGEETPLPGELGFYPAGGPEGAVAGQLLPSEPTMAAASGA